MAMITVKSWAKLSSQMKLQLAEQESKHEVSCVAIFCHAVFRDLLKRFARLFHLNLPQVSKSVTTFETRVYLKPS